MTQGAYTPSPGEVRGGRAALCRLFKGVSTKMREVSGQIGQAARRRSGRMRAETTYDRVTQHIGAIRSPLRGRPAMRRQRKIGLPSCSEATGQRRVGGPLKGVSGLGQVQGLCLA